MKELWHLRTLERKESLFLEKDSNETFGKMKKSSFLNVKGYTLI